MISFQLELEFFICRNVSFGLTKFGLLRFMLCHKYHNIIFDTYCTSICCYINIILSYSEQIHYSEPIFLNRNSSVRIREGLLYTVSIEPFINTLLILV